MLNRFSKDVGFLDDQLIIAFFNFLVVSACQDDSNFLTSVTISYIAIYKIPSSNGHSISS